MPYRKAPFDLDAVDIESKEVAFKGFFRIEKYRLKHQLFEGGWSQTLNRELFCRGPAVAAILYDPDHDLIGMVEQFRIGAMQESYGPWCLEVVAGMIEAGETPEQVMLRELQEEANVTPNRLEFICDYLSSPGGSDEKLYLYCAMTDLTGVSGVHGLDTEGEDIRVCTFPSKEVFQNLYSTENESNRMNNAATLICLQWLQLNRERLMGESR